MPLLTNSRKITTLRCVRKPQTTADSTRGRVENCSSCLNTASWRNKAKFFEIHLRCADPRSILATMFHGQRMLSARPKPCCRLAEFQIRLSSKIFLQTPQKSNVSVSGSNMEAGKFWSATASAHCTKPVQSLLHAPRPNLAARNECKALLVTPGGKRPSEEQMANGCRREIQRRF